MVAQVLSDELAAAAEDQARCRTAGEIPACERSLGAIRLWLSEYPDDPTSPSLRFTTAELLLHMGEPTRAYDAFLAEARQRPPGPMAQASVAAALRVANTMARAERAQDPDAHRLLPGERRLVEAALMALDASTAPTAADLDLIYAAATRLYWQRHSNEAAHLLVVAVAREPDPQTAVSVARTALRA